MNPFTFLYNELLFRPLFNLLVGLTNILPTHNVGVSIILVTLIVRIILLPFSVHQAKSATKNQAKLAEVQTELKKIREKYKNDQAKQAEATLALYRQAGISPAAGCVPLVIQLPVLLALYRVFLIGLGSETYMHLYSFIQQPDALQMTFLGITLTESNVLLALIAGVSQFVLMRLASPAQPQVPSIQDTNTQLVTSMQKNMVYIFPVMTVFIALQLPAALGLYWVATTLFAIVQQYVLKYTLKLNLGGNIPL